jgi:hypothetical protein
MPTDHFALIVEALLRLTADVGGGEEALPLNTVHHLARSFVHKRGGLKGKAFSRNTCTTRLINVGTRNGTPAGALISLQATNRSELWIANT